MTAMPIMNHVGEETWRQKEAKASKGVPAAWGDLEERAVIWEELTATTLLNAGCDIVAMCHPRAVEQIKSAIDKLIGK